MVLQELGGKIAAALQRLQSSSVVDEELLKIVIAEITRALLESDVNIKLVMQLKRNVEAKVNLATNPGQNKRRMIETIVQEELIAMLDPKTPPYQMRKGHSNVVMFVGLQGAGKTTTIAKFAHYYQRKGWKVAMVCADTFRAGAFDQLKQNATKLRVPFYGSYTEADPVRIADEGVQQFRKDKYEVIIVDTSGRHKQEDALFDEMQEIQAVVRPDNCVFVMDATQGQAVSDQARAFHEAVDVGSVVITKLDGHAKGGGALSAVAATRSPITFLGSGEHFDDLEPFVASTFVSKLLGYSEAGGTAKELQEARNAHDAKTLERIQKTGFTLRDMQQQLQMANQMGPFSKMMTMIPGVTQNIAQMALDQNGKAQLKRYMYIMDSMTDAELDCKVDMSISESRIQRVARGSGTRIVEVQAVLKQHKQYSKLVSKMGKSPGGIPKPGSGGMDPANMAVMQKIMQDPSSKASQAALSKMINPQMLKQMGGMEGVVSTLKEMGGMPGAGGGNGPPDMAQMAQMMQNMGMADNSASQTAGVPSGLGGWPSAGVGGAPGGMGGMAAMFQQMQSQPGGMAAMMQQAQQMFGGAAAGGTGNGSPFGGPFGGPGQAGVGKKQARR